MTTNRKWSHLDRKLHIFFKKKTQTTPWFDQFAVGLFTRTCLPGNFKPRLSEDDCLLSFSQSYSLTLNCSGPDAEISVQSHIIKKDFKNKNKWKRHFCRSLEVTLDIASSAVLWLLFQPLLVLPFWCLLSSGWSLFMGQVFFTSRKSHFSINQ